MEPLSFFTAGTCATMIESVEISRILPALWKSAGNNVASFVQMATIEVETARRIAISLMLHSSDSISSFVSPLPSSSFSVKEYGQNFWNHFEVFI